MERRFKDVANQIFALGNRRPDNLLFQHFRSSDSNIKGVTGVLRCPILLFAAVVVIQRVRERLTCIAFHQHAVLYEYHAFGAVVDQPLWLSASPPLYLCIWHSFTLFSVCISQPRLRYAKAETGFFVASEAALVARLTDFRAALSFQAAVKSPAVKRGAFWARVSFNFPLCIFAKYLLPSIFLKPVLTAHACYRHVMANRLRRFPILGHKVTYSGC